MNIAVLRSLTLPAVLGLALTAGCGTPATAPDAANAAAAMELRTYSVPSGYENQVPTMLRAAFGGDGVGRVSVGPAGSVLVLAPEAVQRGVAEFLQELEQAGPAQSGPTPVVMSYWIVLGAPTRGGQGGEGARLEGGAALREVEPALAEIAKRQGSQRFQLLERIQLTSTGEEWARTSGKSAEVSQRATLLPDVVLADIRIEMRGHSIQTQVKLDPGQTVVLAQTGVLEWAQTSEFPAETLYYVVSSRLE